ncbi:hypothetical protein GU700_24710 [Methylobacterium sp. NI91]|nr:MULTISPECIES: hypothetical protein [unclassified Methylobacterium]QIJ77507.1 hypothetical protein CLZ_24715 [Methylobacterium sp. CLZ]QIJ82410.1 hypothetical protein GU700_24710 [Methylobacterium sp. NI91]
MRLLARLAAALAAVALAPLVMVWEGGRWVLKALARPDPVLPTAVAAEDYLDAAAAAGAPLASGHVGASRAIHPTGMTLVRHARHVAAGGDPVDLSALPEPVATWLHSLAPDELAVLACTLPHEAEALAAGTGRVPGLRGPHDGDASASEPTRPDADADVSAYSWPHRRDRSDLAMVDLLAHVEGLRRRQASVA